MSLRMLTGLVIVLAALFCSSCQPNMMDWTFEIVGEVDEQQEWRTIDAKKLPYDVLYVSEDLAFRCDGPLKRGIPGQDIWYSISPADLNVQSFTADITSETIYFCAAGDLYSCDYFGNNLVNLTEDSVLTFMKPVLSHDSRYITMLSMSSVYYGGKLNRLDLMTGELLHLEQPGHASWASYNLELDKFFYCYKYGALYSINPDGSELVQHFSGYDADANVSRTWDSRFLGIWTREAWEQDSCFVFDCLTGKSFVIESIDYVAMNPMKAEISYSQESGDKVKLWRKDLESGDVMLIHGANYKGGDFISGYQLTNYRMDGKKMRFNAFVQTKVQAGFW